jgi:hypothetical protein
VRRGIFPEAKDNDRDQFSRTTTFKRFSSSFIFKHIAVAVPEQVIERLFRLALLEIRRFVRHVVQCITYGAADSLLSNRPS